MPFFDEHPLRTAKRLDFERFATVLRVMQAGAHLSNDGSRWIARETEHMNRRQRSRYLESSEAIRQLHSKPTGSRRYGPNPIATWGVLERNSLSGN